MNSVSLLQLNLTPQMSNPGKEYVQGKVHYLNLLSADFEIGD